MPPVPKKAYIVQIYLYKSKRIIELRPRHGIWSPFIFTIPADQLDMVNPKLYHGAKNSPELSTQVLNFHTRISAEGKLYTFYAAPPASRDYSYYIMCDKLPTSIIFGQLGEEYYKEFRK